MKKLVLRTCMKSKFYSVDKGEYKSLIGVYKSDSDILYPFEVSIVKTNDILEFDFTAIYGSGQYLCDIRVLNSDDTVVNYPINLKLRDKNKPETYKEFLFEKYYVQDINTLNLNYSYNNKENLYPIEVEVFQTDINLNVKKNQIILSNNNKEYNLSTSDNSKLKFIANIKEYIISEDIEGNITKSIKYVDSITIESTKSQISNSSEYFGLVFKTFKNNTLEQLDLEEYTYLKINNRTIYEIYDEDVNSKIPPYNGFDIWEGGSVGDAEIPKKPDNPSFENPINKVIIGDRLKGTMAHSEYAADNTKSIKVGSKVPDNAINLAYYYNKTATFENTMSVVETSTNSVNLKKIDKWIHKSRLNIKDDSIFLDSIEFTGDKDTEFEGYYGKLYKQYVIWDEHLEADLNPEYVKIYKRFSGLLTSNLPKKILYTQNEKIGYLNHLHNTIRATHFDKDTLDNYKYNYKPIRYEANSIYDGFVYTHTMLYSASCKYSGVITKRDGMSNLDPEQKREILMYPNEDGLLEDESGNSNIEDDLFLITDKFKDSTPLYYKHRFKHRIYDKVGKDKYGMVKNDNIKLVFKNGMELNKDKYKYVFDIVETTDKDFYIGYVYTNFITNENSQIYVIYDAVMDDFDANLTITGEDIKVGIKEKLSLVQAIENEKYEVRIEEGLTRRANIFFKEFTILNDNRNKIKLKYYIECNGLKSRVYTQSIVSKRYALSSELLDYVDDNLIVSPKTLNGYLTAKDILFADLTDSEKESIKEDSIFKAVYYTKDFETASNKDKAILYTDPLGDGIVYMRSYYETGFPSNSSENPIYNRILDKNSIYKASNNKVLKGFSVKCKNVSQITIDSPYETHQLKGWYPKIKYSYFSKTYERIDKTIQLIYNVPEFDTQIFSVKYGKPYIEILGEKARIISKNTIKLKNSNLYIRQDKSFEPSTINIYKKNILNEYIKLKISYFNAKDGIIELDNLIGDNDNVYVDYVYEESFYHYRGYYYNYDKTTKLINLNLNPNAYFTYTNTENEIFYEKPSYELFNKTIHFFLKPSRVIDKDTGEVIEDNLFTVYHKINNQKAEGPYDLHIGRIFTRHHASSESTIVIDTRKRGGGVLEEIKDNIRRELEPESDFYLDISTIDGEAYQVNSVIIVKVSNKLLKINGGKYVEDDIKRAIDKWCAVGTMPIIEFVNIIDGEEFVNNSIKINKHIDNKVDYTPKFRVEVITS